MTRQVTRREVGELRGMATLGSVRPWRILHVLAPAAYGGMERVVMTLARAQAIRGHEVHLAVTLGLQDERPGWLTPLEAGGITVHEVRTEPRAYFQERDALAALCRRVGVQLVHSHGYRPDVVAACAARSCGLPTVSTVHGFTGGDLRNRMYEKLQRVALRSCNAVVAVSAPLREQLLRSGVQATTLHVTPNAWDGSIPRFSREQARARLGLEPQDRVLGWVGRLSREKGCDLAVAALNEAGLEDYRLVILGDGPERPLLEQMARRVELGRRLHFAGTVTNAADYFRAFDGFVLSSRTEGTPIALFEAMAAEVPLIATRVGGVPDVISEREAWLAAQVDAASIAECIRRLAADPLGTAARVKRARARLEDFRLDRWVETYDAIYGRTLNVAGAHGH